MSIDRSVSQLQLTALQNELKLAHSNILVLTDVLNSCVQQLNSALRPGATQIAGIHVSSGPMPNLFKGPAINTGRGFIK